MSPAEAIYGLAYHNIDVGGPESMEVSPYATTVPGINDHIRVSSSPEAQSSHHQFGTASQWEHPPPELHPAHPSIITTSTSTGYTAALHRSTLSHYNQPGKLCPRKDGASGLNTTHYDDGTDSSRLQHSSRSVHRPLSDCPYIESDGQSTNAVFCGDELLGLPGTFGISHIQANSQQDPVTTRHSEKKDDWNFNRFNSLQESISQGTNKSLISTSLLCIYNDTLENALSCWVTENNCPYQKLKRKDRDLLHPGLKPKAEIATHFSIYARVCRLDEVFVPFNSRSTTKTDGRKASKALYASMMAFASQWSHVRNMETSFDGDDGLSGLAPTTSTAIDGFAAPFECLLQQSLWHECQRSLLACGNSDSFKVIFARMIFSMTQRSFGFGEREKILESHVRHRGLTPGSCRVQFPSTSADLNPFDLGPASFNSGDRRGLETHSLAQIDAVKNWDGPPTYLETALRCLASWRRRIAAHCSVRTHTTSSAQLAQMPHAVDLQSFDMLFWLGVMCDTTSSALTQRPLVIVEEDCELTLDTSRQALPLYPTVDARVSSTYDVGDTNGASTMSKLWGTYLLSSRRLSGDQAQWPCDTDEVYAILQEAIPVKVLLWRRVARLQTLRNSSTDHEDIEDSIAATLSVYQHWNMAYGQFMRGCVADHQSLPVKVQSWYMILAGHWHLGCLLAANCIEWVDNDLLSAGLQRSLRRSSNLVMELKKANANAISDLAQVSCASDRQTSQDSVTFHSALNETALLTEPWTNVLIQALERACGIFLTWLSCQRNVADEQREWIYHHTNQSDLCSRASSCIYALKLLGRKSDAASLTAAALETQLTLVTSDEGLLVPSIWTADGALSWFGGVNGGPD
ncbi:hypothetical protein BJY01DRAFT_255131 [Aspergillus pseudoustus]|uniref:Fungal-specific transcription factor domain-containing protein n=1 Tax=Aspergillus pseudoustus TaxID=1810923 RepID=A0ABR4IMX5_9EURO